MTQINAVRDTATGDLKRWGCGVDFENDGSFDTTTETYMTDVGRGLISKKTYGSDYHQWDGSAFVLVTYTAPKTKRREKIMGEVLSAAEPVTQLPRLLNALRKYPEIVTMLDNDNYSLSSTFSRNRASFTLVSRTMVNKNVSNELTSASSLRLWK